MAGGGAREGPPLPAQDLADTAVTDTQLPGDVTGPHPLMGQVHDALAHTSRQRAPIHKGSAQLVQPSMACREEGGSPRGSAGARGGNQGIRSPNGCTC